MECQWLKSKLVVPFHVLYMGEVKMMDEARIDMYTSTDGEGSRTTFRCYKRARDDNKDELLVVGCGGHPSCVGKRTWHVC